MSKIGTVHKRRYTFYLFYDLMYALIVCMFDFTFTYEMLIKGHTAKLL